MQTILAVTVTGLLCLLHIYARLPREHMQPLQRRRVLASTIRTAGAIAWPAMLLAAVPSADQGRLVLVAPLLWNAMMWGIDSYLVHHAPSAEATRPASLRLDPSSLTGLTFGLCGLLGARPDSEYTHLFLYAIVGCIVLVLPSHNLEAGCLEEQVFESVQKAAILWCIGYLIAGIALTRSAPPHIHAHTASTR